MTNLREVGWNGVRFRAPGHWQLARIGRRDLLMESERGPVFEIKWAAIRGRFSHEKTMRRLASASGRRGRAALQAKPPPASWRSALRGFDIAGFSWRTGGLEARGLTIYCPVCNHATLLQFFLPAGGGGGIRTAPDLLRSFADHPDGETRLWSVFDVRAELPLSFLHRHHRFLPGAYEMAFRDGSLALTLHRWAAAPVWARHGSLTEAAEGLLQPPPAGRPNEPTAPGGHPTVEWSERFRHGLARRLAGRGTTYRITRLWHDTDRGRILGIRTEDRRPIPADLAERLTAAFRIV